MGGAHARKCWLSSMTRARSSSAVVEIHCTVINEKVKSILVPKLYLHIF